MIKLDVLQYDTIILGGTLQALVHSYVEGLPLIMVNPQIPFYRDLDSTGVNKQKIWNKLSFYLSYAGLNPLEQKASSYRFDENNIITIFGKAAYKIQVQYNNIVRYDQVQLTDKMRVFDYIKLQNIQKNEIDVINNIKTEEDFVNQFYTMIEDRASDIVAISSLSQQQLNKEEYSEVYARLKTENMLKNQGIVGRVESISSGGYRTHRLKTTTIKREILTDTRKQEDEILSQRKETKSSLMKNITELFGSPYVE